MGKQEERQKKLIQSSHLIDMNDIIREGNPTLRKHAEEVSRPLSDEDIILGEKMLDFLRNSQDPVLSEKMGLRAGVGLAAPQLDVSKRIIAVLLPNADEEDGNGDLIPPEQAYALSEIFYNAKIVSESVQEAALADGEGCLSVDREVPGYVVRKARITVEYVNKAGEAKRAKFRGYPAIVLQHEIDHTNGLLFYDRINASEPFQIKEGMLVIE